MAACTLTPEQVCSRLQLTRSELDLAIKDEVIRPLRLGKKLRFLLEDIEALEELFL